MSRVDDLIAAGFVQTSRKYRMLARLPPGKSGLEALADTNPQLAKLFLDQANRSATEHYVRLYAKAEDKVTLTEREFDEFLTKTGRSGRSAPPLVEEARKAADEAEEPTP